MDYDYRVQWLQDDTYKVYRREDMWYGDGEDEEPWEEVFQGGLADCEAYIRLNEKGYL